MRIIFLTFLSLLLLAACQPSVVIPEGADPWYVSHLAITHDSLALCEKVKYNVEECKNSIQVKRTKLLKLPLYTLIIPSHEQKIFDYLDYNNFQPTERIATIPTREYKVFNIYTDDISDSCINIWYAAFKDNMSSIIDDPLLVSLCGALKTTYTCLPEEGQRTTYGKSARMRCCANNGCANNITVSTIEHGVERWTLLNITLRTLSDKWNIDFK